MNHAHARRAIARTLAFACLALGALAGGLTTMQFGATARTSVAPLPLEEMQHKLGIDA